jgi:very-short-patch-repair endonuclease
LRGKDERRAERARALRRALTPAESALWTRLRDRQLGGYKFARQESIDRYYVDFVCREQRLIIELDGGQHSDRPEDTRRDSELCALGYRVIRIWNNDVIENLDGVLQTLLSELEKRPLTPPLSPQAGRGRADAVRAFYESHPYPAPIGNLDRHRDLYRNPDRRRASSLLMWPTDAEPPRLPSMRCASLMLA